MQTCHKRSLGRDNPRRYWREGVRPGLSPASGIGRLSSQGWVQAARCGVQMRLLHCSWSLQQFMGPNRAAGPLGAGSPLWSRCLLPPWVLLPPRGRLLCCSGTVSSASSGRGLPAATTRLQRLRRLQSAACQLPGQLLRRRHVALVSAASLTPTFGSPRRLRGSLPPLPALGLSRLRSTPWDAPKLAEGGLHLNT